MRFRSLAAAAFAFSLGAFANADVTLPSIFSDHMVLQSGGGVPVWGKADPQEKVTVVIGDETQSATADADGKWSVLFQSVKATGPQEVKISGKNEITIHDVLVGQVWLCSGQSNMDFRIAKTKDRPWCGVKNEAEEIAAANYPQIRMFIAEVVMKDEPQSNVPGRWLVCSPETAGEFSAVAYYFGRELHQSLNVPIGLVLSTYGGSTAQAWMSEDTLKNSPTLSKMLEDYSKSKAAWDSGETMKKFEADTKAHEVAAAKAKEENKPAPKAPRKPVDPRLDQHSPCVLYNGMLKPLAPYGIRGVIWYQGESNGYNANQYLELMTSLIRNWRKDWQLPAEGMPFLSVQLASYRAPTTQPVEERSQIAQVRDAQFKTLREPFTGLACAVDLGEEKDIHPRNKLDVGKRLAMAAKGLVYKQSVATSGPLYESFDTTVPGSLRIHFTHTDGGLVAKDGKLAGFAIKSADGKWVAADAKIDGDTIVLSNPEIAQPIAARYAWADNPPMTLFNGAGLPASPFRTDE